MSDEIAELLCNIRDILAKIEAKIPEPKKHEMRWCGKRIEDLSEKEKEEMEMYLKDRNMNFSLAVFQNWRKG